MCLAMRKMTIASPMSPPRASTAIRKIRRLILHLKRAGRGHQKRKAEREEGALSPTRMLQSFLRRTADAREGLDYNSQTNPRQEK
jgi:hypothetical protein